MPQDEEEGRMSETTGTGDKPSEAPITPPAPGEAGYEDVSGGETTPQSGAGSAAEDAEPSGDDSEG
jgi:hypothetical protein